MGHVTRVSDTYPVYQVAVTKSICFVSALFNKLFILYKKKKNLKKIPQRKLNSGMVKVTLDK